jgi:hypothetical protein
MTSSRQMQSRRGRPRCAARVMRSTGTARTEQTLGTQLVVPLCLVMAASAHVSGCDVRLRAAIARWLVVRSDKLPLVESCNHTMACSTQWQTPTYSTF